MITWGFLVTASDAGETRAAILVCPDRLDAHGELGARFRTAGLKRVNAPLWGRFALDVSSCLVTVEGTWFTEMHTGRSRLVASEPQPLTPLWLTAAKSGRVVLALVPPGTFAGLNMGPDGNPAEVWGETLDALAAGPGLVAGFAAVIDKPAPAAGSGTSALRM